MIRSSGTRTPVGLAAAGGYIETLSSRPHFGGGLAGGDPFPHQSGLFWRMGGTGVEVVIGEVECSAERAPRGKQTLVFLLGGEEGSSAFSIGATEEGAGLGLAMIQRCEDSEGAVLPLAGVTRPFALCPDRRRAGTCS